MITAKRRRCSTACWITAMFDAAREIKEAVDIRTQPSCTGFPSARGGRRAAPSTMTGTRPPRSKMAGSTVTCAICTWMFLPLSKRWRTAGSGEAMERLNSLFRLGLDLKKPLPSAEIEKRRKEQERREAERTAYRRLYEDRQAEYIRIRRTPAPPPRKPVYGRIRPAFGPLGLFGMVVQRKPLEVIPSEPISQKTTFTQRPLMKRCWRSATRLNGIWRCGLCPMSHGMSA